MVKRLTEQKTTKGITRVVVKSCVCEFQTVLNKLCAFEDIMEKYGIESVEELEQELKIAHEIERLKDKNIDLNNAIIVFNKNFIKDYIREIEELKVVSDTWKRACELACRHIAEVEWLSCPETDDISESENEIKTLTKQSLNYFYQQIKELSNNTFKCEICGEITPKECEGGEPNVCADCVPT